MPLKPDPFAAVVEQFIAVDFEDSKIQIELLLQKIQMHKQRLQIETRISKLNITQNNQYRFAIQENKGCYAFI